MVQLGNPRIENLEIKSNLTNNVQKVQNDQYKLYYLAKETQILKDKVTTFFLNFSKDNTYLQVKVTKMIVSELENIGIDREELIGRLRETKHDINDLMGILVAVELTATKLCDHSYTDEEKSDTMKLKFDIYDTIGPFPRMVSELAKISNKLEPDGGVDAKGYDLSYDMDAAQWSKDNNGIFAIFVNGVAIMNAMIATVTHTAESNITKEA